VLAHWFTALTTLHPLYNSVWWISVLGLIATPFFGGFLFHELAQRYRVLNEEISLTGRFKPRSLAELHSAGGERVAEPLALGNDQSFFAGGIQWHWEDFTKNSIIFGQPGSGKTLCVLNSLLEGVLGSAGKAGLAPGGLILDPKGDFAGKIRALCLRYGRGHDLMVIDPHVPEGSIRWNPLDSDDDELELATRFAAVLETLGMKGGETSFWIDAAKKFFRHALTLVRLTNRLGEPPTFFQIQELAAGFQAIAQRTDRLDIRDPRCDQCLSFFANEWADLAEETRTSIQAHVTNMLDPFLMEPYASMFAGRSTCRISNIVDAGKILYVHMPIADKEAMARTIGTFVKLEYFREVLKRPDKPRPSFFLCDEFQVFFTTGQGKGDADFFERNRQSNHANIIATQNIPALLRLTPRKEPVTNLLGNCAVKIFLRNSDQETNEYGAALFGQHLVAMVGAQGAAGSGRFRSLGQSIGATDQYDQVLRPERFAALAVPSRDQTEPYCEAIIYLGARAEAELMPQKLRWRANPIQV
jgi:hypothetical protein